MIKVYQIQLTDEEVDIINTDGEWTPRIKAFFGRNIDSKFEAENFQYYTHVANVDTNDMEEAFHRWDCSVKNMTPVLPGRCEEYPKPLAFAFCRNNREPEHIFP